MAPEDSAGLRLKVPVPRAAGGSRRRRLWELPPQAHCPVLGLCLPFSRLRAVVDRAAGGVVIADDYGLHCGAVADARQRTATSEALQRELDSRHAGSVRAAGAARDSETLLLWWRQTAPGAGLPGALWAALTHPRCDYTLEETVLQEVHMLQHRLAEAGCASLERLEALSRENAVLARELGAAQQRCTRIAQEQARRIEQLQSQAIQLRAELIGRDTLVVQVRESLDELRRSVPHLGSRRELARLGEQQLERIRQLEKQLVRERERADREARRAHALQQALSAGVQEPPGPAASPVVLDDRAVLCVGGRSASVPVYRALVEGTGARFLHHDGGEEDNVGQLDATLAAADIVICQAGCVSHDAYWRVKDHCKRTGKPCVFVEQPSRTGLQKALQRLSGGAATEVCDGPALPS